MPGSINPKNVALQQVSSIGGRTVEEEQQRQLNLLNVFKLWNPSLRWVISKPVELWMMMFENLTARLFTVSASSISSSDFSSASLMRPNPTPRIALFVCLHPCVLCPSDVWVWKEALQSIAFACQMDGGLGWHGLLLMCWRHREQSQKAWRASN